jgi:hypothetical protein
MLSIDRLMKTIPEKEGQGWVSEATLLIWVPSSEEWKPMG